MRIAAYGVLFVLAWILQTTVFASLPIFGAYADLMVVVVITFGMLNGKNAGAKIGFAAGLFEDILLGRLVGLNAVSMMIGGFLAGLAAEKLYKDNYIVPAFFTLTGTWVVQLIYLVGAVLFGVAVDLNWIALRAALLSGLYNALIAMVLCKWFAYLNDRIAYWDELVKRSG